MTTIFMAPDGVHCIDDDGTHELVCQACDLPGNAPRLSTERMDEKVDEWDFAGRIFCLAGLLSVAVFFACAYLIWKAVSR